MTTYQWLVLSKILARCTDTKTAFEVLEKIYPENIRIKQIIELLYQGEPLDRILIKDSYERKLSYYINYCSLKQAIELLNEKQKRYTILKKQIAEKLGYQLLLVVASFAILVLFTQMVLPVMISSLQVHDSTVEIEFKVLNITKNIIILLTAFVIGLIVYIKLRKRETYFWMLAHRLKIDGLLKMVATYNLAGDLNILLNQGMSIKDSLDIIRTNKEYPLTSLLAYHLHNSLAEGNDIKDSLCGEFIDRQFYGICVYGLDNDDFCNSLQDYIDMVSVRIETLVKRTSVILQTVCYLFVATVIILAYQVLLMPLELLEELK